MSLVTYKERKWKCYLTNGASIAHKLEKTLSRRPQNHSNFNFAVGVLRVYSLPCRRHLFLHSVIIASDPLVYSVSRPIPVFNASYSIVPKVADDRATHRVFTDEPLSYCHRPILLSIASTLALRFSLSTPPLLNQCAFNH